MARPAQLGDDGPPGRAEAADREGVRRLRRHLRLPAGAGRAGPPRRARRPGARPDADAGAGPAALPAAAVAADHDRRRRCRDFTADRPAVKLVGDITYIPTWQGWLFLATVIDCYTKAPRPASATRWPS